MIEAGVEVIDMYPIFFEKKEQYDLFSKEHHISALGAKDIGKTIAEYLRNTTDGIDDSFNISHDTYEIYQKGFYELEQCRELCDVYYVKNEKNEDIKRCYWNIGQDNSKICLFGDCNLQSYNSIGGGITNNTTYYLKHPIVDEGRKLVFGYEEKPLLMEELKELEKYEIIVYVAFASAPFVRSSLLSLRNPKMEYKWQHLNLWNKEI